MNMRAWVLVVAIVAGVSTATPSKGWATYRGWPACIPSTSSRQLILFKEGGRKGPDAAPMQKPTAQLNERDIIDISAYAASLNPE